MNLAAFVLKGLIGIRNLAIGINMSGEKEVLGLWLAGRVRIFV
jgi:hypothetical protein